MLVMETIRKIRVRRRNGDGIRQISRDLRLSRNTVRKFIKKKELSEPVYERKIPYYPQLGNYLDMLRHLVIENKSAKRARQKRALYDDLKAAGYKGSYSAVCRQIRRIEFTEQKASCRDAYVPLDFEPGEAYQFDWSTQYIQIGAEITEVKVAHFVMCYSRHKYTRAYLRERQEMLFDAHVKAFTFYGGSPKRGIYDNMKTAVTKILKGKEREWNPAFERLCAHYCVEPVACNPAAGWEKGRVERQVDIDRNRFFTPIPKVNSLEEFNEQLLSQVIMYNRTKRHPTMTDKCIEEVYEQEKSSLKQTCLKFNASRSKDVKVSTTCLVMFDRNQYSIDCHYAGKIVQCRAYAERLVFIYEGKEVAKHKRYFTRGKTYYDWYHYLPLLERKPGALRNGAPFKTMELPESLQIVRKHFDQKSTNNNVFAQLLSTIPQTSLEALDNACQKAITDQAISYEVIVNYLFRSTEHVYEEPISIPQYLTLSVEPIADCSRYNQYLARAI